MMPVLNFACRRFVTGNIIVGRFQVDLIATCGYHKGVVILVLEARQVQPLILTLGFNTENVHPENWKL